MSDSSGKRAGSSIGKRLLHLAVMLGIVGLLVWGVRPGRPKPPSGGDVATSTKSAGDAATVTTTADAAKSTDVVDAGKVTTDKAEPAKATPVQQTTAASPPQATTAATTAVAPNANTGSAVPSFQDARPLHEPTPAKDVSAKDVSAKDAPEQAGSSPASAGKVAAPSFRDARSLDAAPPPAAGAGPSLAFRDTRPLDGSDASASGGMAGSTPPSFRDARPVTAPSFRDARPVVSGPSFRDERPVVPAPSFRDERPVAGATSTATDPTNTAIGTTPPAAAVPPLAATASPPAGSGSVAGASAPAAATATTSPPPSAANAAGVQASVPVTASVQAASPAQQAPAASNAAQTTSAPAPAATPAPALPTIVAVAPPPLRVDAGSCAAPHITTEPLDGGRMRIIIEATCRAGEAVQLSYGGAEMIRKLDGHGRLDMAFDAFAGAQNPLQLRFADASRQTIPVITRDLDRVSKIAVIWRAPVNLDLHVFEYAARYDQPGHLWAKAASSLERARTEMTGDNRGHGFLSTSDDEASLGDKVEVYTFLHSDEQTSGAISLALDYETRGEVPSGATCGQGALAEIDFQVSLLPRGGQQTRQAGVLTRVDCGQRIAREARLNQSALPGLRIRR